MKRLLILLALLLCCAVAAPCALAAVSFVPFELTGTGVTAAFPVGWAVVTPDTVENNMKWFSEESAAIARNNMLSEGVLAVAFSSDGDSLRVLSSEDDDSVLYYDIDRYTNEMRAAIRADFLDRDAWALTGYRFTNAEWTNRDGQRRILWMDYTLRYDDTIVARGLQAFTVRGGRRLTLQFRTANKVEDADETMFRNFVAGFVFPEPNEEEMKLLPVGLTVTGGLPEETNQKKLALKGKTEKKATVTASVVDTDGNTTLCGSVAAGSDGAYRLTAELPGEGEWQLIVTATKDGYADSSLTSLLKCKYNMMPVNFTSYLSGDVYDDKLVLSGKTLPGVKIQCIEGDTNKTAHSDSSGNFSFTLDRGLTGKRTVVLAMSKKGYPERRFVIEFNRCWAEGAYAAYLKNQAESLSYKNLVEKGDRYAGRIVCYDGTVEDISSSGTRTYVRFARDGDAAMQLFAVLDSGEVTVSAGETAQLYFRVTGESYTMSMLGTDGEVKDVALPAVTLLSLEAAQ